MGRITSEIGHFFKTKSILSILIAINIASFIVVLLVGLILVLFNGETNVLLHNLELPADLHQLLRKPWTLVTYMFTHVSFWHILFNLLWLYWFGKLFDMFFGSRPMGSLYLLGGIGGALLFILAYNVFPYFQAEISRSYLIGASASIMAIVFASAIYKPDYKIGLLFLGNIKIIYIALVLLLINLITLQSTGADGRIVLNNAGGFFAHLGGILVGLWFANAYKRGKDITKGLNSLFDSVSNLFKKQPKKKMRVSYKRAESDMEYNTRKNSEQAAIDKILDKIKHSGYDALTDDEKNKLFDAGKK